MYRVEIRSRAEKDIEALPSRVRYRILETIATLGSEPRPNGVQKLAADGGYRVRVGDYRIVYEIADVARIVAITRVRHRRDVYRNI